MRVRVPPLPPYAGLAQLVRAPVIKIKFWLEKITIYIDRGVAQLVTSACLTSKMSWVRSPLSLPIRKCPLTQVGEEESLLNS